MSYTYVVLTTILMASDSDRKGEIEYEGNSISLNPDFLNKYVAAGRVSINRNVIAKCLEFCEIPLLKYFIEPTPIQPGSGSNPNFPYTPDQFTQPSHQIDTLSWCAHQIEMEDMSLGIHHNDRHRPRPFYDNVNKLAGLYRRKPTELPNIDFNQIILPQELDELICTIAICCKYYIADCLKKAQVNALAQGSTIITARHIYEAARKESSQL